MHTTNDSKPGPRPQGRINCSARRSCANVEVALAQDEVLVDVPISVLQSDPDVAKRLRGEVVISGRVPEHAPRTPASASLLPDGTLRIYDGTHRIAGGIVRGESTYPVKVRLAAPREDYPASVLADYPDLARVAAECDDCMGLPVPLPKEKP